MTSSAPDGDSQADRGSSCQPAESSENGPGRRLARIMANPFIGFAPWIVLAVLEGPGRLTLATGVALGMSVAFLAIDKAMGRSTKILAVVDVACFSVFLVIGLLASPIARQWMETWFGELANLVLVLVVAGSLIARVPFTIQYAKEETEPAYWGSPVFIRINYVITAVWGLAFLVSSIAGFYGDAVLHNNNNLWTGWIIQIAASLVAVQFTSWYPNYASALALRGAGLPAEPPPPVAALLAPLLGYLVPIGILELAFGAGPLWLGIGLIGIGAAGAARLRRKAIATAG